MGKNFSLKADLIIGIGDLGNLTGVSPRQLRYWEEKKYIESVTEERSSGRKYQFEMFFKVQAIKKFLDEGFTLAKAAEQAEQQRKKVEICKKFISEAFEDVVVEDPNGPSGKIIMGFIDKRKSKRVIGIVDEKGSHFEIQQEE
ncbi:MerR family transcriptional regulator [Liquorilactobacillus oeni]|uniref:MerR family transcriptional regulator n=1 Tax=Liquorilactobacillus oeni DSM 19972 TaxID=1423777 RepID=A0A0R1MIZ2_9LACO|nr:MerR family transcriptional regulator [Liquorilactobacillus oeni]KRL05908.1 MerR family transcriptional regulator [Liquorilactobacillus oeni DSM 19972]